MTDPSELPRPVRLDQLGEAPRTEVVTATADERAALARRFGLIAIDRLAATADVRRAGDTVLADGRIDAQVVQACAATGVPLRVAIAEPFAIRFEPRAAVDAAQEVELDAGDLDVVAYDGGAIDLGEAIAETLALAIDPFLRAPDAEARLREAGVVGEEEAEVGPFAGLKALLKGE